MARHEAPDYIASLVDKLKSIVEAAAPYCVSPLPWQPKPDLIIPRHHSAASIQESGCRP
jgi:hypothetical protein